MANTLPSVPPPTKAQWLAQGTPAKALLAKGDIVSARLIEQLLVDAEAIVQTAP